MFSDRAAAVAAQRWKTFCEHRSQRREGRMDRGGGGVNVTERRLVSLFVIPASDVCYPQSPLLGSRVVG